MAREKPITKKGVTHHTPTTHVVRRRATWWWMCKPIVVIRPSPKKINYYKTKPWYQTHHVRSTICKCRMEYVQNFQMWIQTYATFLNLDDIIWKGKCCALVNLPFCLKVKIIICRCRMKYVHHFQMWVQSCAKFRKPGRCIWKAKCSTLVNSPFRLQVKVTIYICKWWLWPTDTQKDYFCPGTGIWVQKCPDNLFGQIKGYKRIYYCLSCKM